MRQEDLNKALDYIAPMLDHADPFVVITVVDGDVIVSGSPGCNCAVEQGIDSTRNSIEGLLEIALKEIQTAPATSTHVTKLPDPKED